MNEKKAARTLGLPTETIVEAIENGDLEARRSLDGTEWTITEKALNSYQRKLQRERQPIHSSVTRTVESSRYSYIRFYQGFNTFLASVILAATLVLALAAYGLYPERGLLLAGLIGVIGLLGFVFQMVWSDVIQVALDMEEHMREMRNHITRLAGGSGSRDAS